jgi:hypothetical protein
MAQKYLTPDELVDYVTRVAGQPKLWKHLVEHGERRGYKELASTPTFNCWVITWNTGHDTGLHDHDGSAGGVICVHGQVRESRLRSGYCESNEGVIKEHGLIYREGQTFNFGPWDIHRVRHHGESTAITIHAYSPPLTHMGSYGFIAGEFKRQPLKDEELRPLEVAIKDAD